MPTRKPTDDPLRKAAPVDRVALLDRVFYATGAMLDVGDFNAEQAYHRGRLARALAYLHGWGTVAGLRVSIDPAVPPAPGEDEGREETLAVSPGMAIDRLGRIIEVPRRACLRLDRWFENQRATDNGTELRTALGAGAILVDVFIAYVACERGKTPAFASGGFEALNAQSPSRLRDSYRLDLVVRPPGAPLPVNTWPDIFAAATAGDRQTAAVEAILSAWREGTEFWDETRDGPNPLIEHKEGEDTTAVFLARVTLPAAAGPSGTPPVRSGAATADNGARPIVYTAGRWLGQAAAQ
jgi:hypothetical protein